ncbi:hypothetical protein RJE46_24455 (plasmid) [Cedecea neteri]|uniref:hypothetical protein n=1 Tax=Cedecea neteri TaxID=158822 RepID=UPI0028935A80|nr:hypothetical protein [Cedecea neteri]WNJ82232.1 hypothetical protein RJE46_24455 [Cedecea neteri]
MKGDLSQNLKLFVEEMLGRIGVPEARRTHLRKKIGRSMLLLSVLGVIPNFIWHFSPLVVTLGQVAWASLLFLGCALAMKPKAKQQK